MMKVMKAFALAGMISGGLVAPVYADGVFDETRYYYDFVDRCNPFFVKHDLCHWAINPETDTLARADTPSSAYLIARQKGLEHQTKIRNADKLILSLRRKRQRYLSSLKPGE